MQAHSLSGGLTLGEETIPPDRFLPAAATAGLLADLDQQMLRMALEASGALHHADPDGALTLSINLSDAVLSSDAGRLDAADGIAGNESAIAS